MSILTEYAQKDVCVASSYNRCTKKAKILNLECLFVLSLSLKVVVFFRLSWTDDVQSEEDMSAFYREVVVLRKPPENFSWGRRTILCVFLNRSALQGPVDFTRSALQELQGVSDKF